ncbi:hypothetical protein KQY13_34570 [Streptomyces sp. PAM3C]|nr:hypothetical protein [Streptomyces sp. PAM3C]
MCDRRRRPHGRPESERGVPPADAGLLCWGPGARAIIGAWPRKGVGHYFNVASIDGKVVFLDLQSGKANPAHKNHRDYHVKRTN